MILPLLLWLTAASPRADLVDEMVTLPAAEWRYVELHLDRNPVTVVCQYDAPPGSRVRVALLTAEDLVRMRQDEPHGILALTRAGAHGYLRHRVHLPGDYSVVLDNRESGASASRVRLRVSLDFISGGEPAVRTLSSARRTVVVAASCLVFLGIVGFAGRTLLRGMRR